jgi:hypothetical protein
MCMRCAAGSNLYLLRPSCYSVKYGRHIWRACPDGIILKLFVFNTRVNTGILPWEKPRQPPTELMSTLHTWLYSHIIRRYIIPAFGTLTQELKNVNECSFGMPLMNRLLKWKARWLIFGPKFIQIKINAVTLIQICLYINTSPFGAMHEMSCLRTLSSLFRV